MTLDDVILGAAGLLFAAGLMAREMLVLRLLILAAAALPAGWAAANGAWTVAAWAGLFMAVNGWNLVAILRGRMDIELDPELARIHAAVFSDLGRREFLSFWNFGTEMDFSSGERLIAEGEAPEHLMYVVEGAVRVVRGEREIARLGVDAFVGEMSFLTARPASADVLAAGRVRVMTWSQRRLNDLGQLNPALLARINRILGRDLADKIAGRPAPKRTSA